jgi:3-hydroxybutyryl-CoA dehydrogenase
MILPPLSVAMMVKPGHDPFPVNCAEPVILHHYHDFSLFCQAHANLFIDCDFSPSAERIKCLTALAAPVIVNSVSYTTREIGSSMIRFNGWTGFSHQSVLELAPDTAGMVRARIIAMIINEAYHALGEGVSTEEDIDTAMKLGTNYPYGPFEWASRIGHDNIVELLEIMSLTDKKYQPAPALVAAAKS